MGVEERGSWEEWEVISSYKENMTGTEKLPADSIFRELGITVFGKA